jgi:peroxin-2
MVPYLWVRISRYSVSENWGSFEADDWRKKTWKLMNFVDKYLKIIVLINFLIFLYNGKYRNIIDRVVSMRLVYSRPLMTRNVSFDYMNKELIWNGFAEIILFIFPLINVDKIWNFWKKILPTKKNQETSQPDSIIGECPICQERIQIPFVTNCQHIYCYYCLKNATFQDSQFECLKCFNKVTTIKRLNV